MKLTAINKKYDSKINRMYSHYRKYHELTNLIDIAMTQKSVNELERRIEKAFEKFETIKAELPAREFTHFESQHFKLHGYK